MMFLKLYRVPVAKIWTAGSDFVSFQPTTSRMTELIWWKCMEPTILSVSSRNEEYFI